MSFRAIGRGDGPYLAAISAGAVALGYLLSTSSSAPVIAAFALVLVTASTLFLAARLHAAVWVADDVVQATHRPSGMADIVFAGLGAYALLFSVVPNGARLALAGALTAGMLLVGARNAFTSRGSVGRVLLALVLGLAIATVAGAALGIHHLALVQAVRFFAPLVFAAGVVANPFAIRSRTIAIVTFVVLAVGLYVSLSKGVGVVSDVKRLEPFTGGADGIHSSAYILASSVIVIDRLRMQGLVRPSLAWLAVCAGVIGVLGLRVTTALAVLVVYFTLQRMIAARSIGGRVAVALCCALVLAGAFQLRVSQQASAVYGAPSATSSLNGLSSGRLEAWQQRLKIFDSGRALVLLLAGSGVGSDPIATVAWDGEMKSSHNDFLTVFYEQGVVGILLLTAYFGVVLAGSGTSGLPIVGAFLTASFLSNGLLQRPLIQPILWIALGLALQRRETDRRSS